MISNKSFKSVYIHAGSLKNRKGITLIALVITTIILLILAGITINTIAGDNGLFARAKQAKEEQLKAQAEESIKTAIMEIQTEDIPNGEEVTLSTIKDKLPSKDSNITLKEYTKEDNNLKGTYKIGNKDIDFTIDDNFNVIIDGEIKEGKKEETKEIEVTAPYIGTATNVTNASQSVADNTQTKGTTLYINFTATLDGANCKITLKGSDDEITLPYPITKNGTYEFTTIGTYKGKNISKDIEVKVNKYNAIGGFVQYDAGNWTQAEIQELQKSGLYNINIAKAVSNTSGLDFTFGGFTYKGDTANQASIANGTVITSRNQSVASESGEMPKEEGWQILESKIESGKTYVTKLVHAGQPENFVFYDATSYDNLRVEYLLSGGLRQTGYNKFSNGTTIKLRNWDKYKDTSLDAKGYIKDVHVMTYDEAMEITGNTNPTNGIRNTGSIYWLASAEDNEDDVREVEKDGSISFSCEKCYGVRPVVTLTSRIYIASGDGTESNPYVLGKD